VTSEKPSLLRSPYNSILLKLWNYPQYFASFQIPKTDVSPSRQQVALCVTKAERIHGRFFTLPFTTTAFAHPRWHNGPKLQVLCQTWAHISQFLTKQGFCSYWQTQLEAFSFVNSRPIQCHRSTNYQCNIRDLAQAVLYSLTETEIETEIYIILLSETEMDTEMFCKTETKYKRKSESIKRNSNWTKLISQRKWLHKMFSKIWHLTASIWWFGDNWQHSIMTLASLCRCHSRSPSTCTTMESWKSTLISTYTNFGHICQKMPSPSEADSRQSIHCFRHWPKNL